MKKTDFVTFVQRAKNGDGDAFAELYSLVYKQLYHIALCNLNNPEDAADIVSDTVLDAFASMKTLRSPEAFKAWIVRILTVKIKNKQREYIEKRNAQQDIEDVEQELIAETDFDNVELWEEFSKLEKKERLALSMNVVAGYTSDEIAKACNEKPATIRSQLSRAKQKLKQRLLF